MSWLLILSSVFLMFYMHVHVRMLPYSGIGLGTRLAPVLREHFTYTCFVFIYTQMVYTYVHMKELKFKTLGVYRLDIYADASRR